MKSILDPTFRYTPSVQTDVRKTFARIRRELRAQAANATSAVDGRTNVMSLSSRRALPAGIR